MAWLQQNNDRLIQRCESWCQTYDNLLAEAERLIELIDHAGADMDGRPWGEASADQDIKRSDINLLRAAIYDTLPPYMDEGAVPTSDRRPLLQPFLKNQSAT